MNGFTLQAHALNDAVRWDCPLGLWLAQQHALCVVLSVLTVAYETFFWIVIPWPRLVPVFVPAGILVHVGIYYTQAAPFFQFIVLFVVFFDFEHRRFVWFIERDRDKTGIQTT